MRALGVLALLCGTAIGCVRREVPLPSASPDFVVPPAPKALDFTLPQHPDGKPHSISAERGSVVLLDVWATWCEPCRDALPLYAQLKKQYEARGLRVFAINVDEDVSQLTPFLEELKVSLPILLDQNAKVSERLLKVRIMPTTFVLDRRGVVRFVHEGFAEEFLGKYQREIEALLAEAAP